MLLAIRLSFVFALSLAPVAAVSAQTEPATTETPAKDGPAEFSTQEDYHNMMQQLGIIQDLNNATMPAVNHGLVDGTLAWRQHDGGHTDGPNMPHFIKWCDAHFSKETSP